MADQEMTLVELCATADVSRTQLYHFFEGKKDITLGWLEQVADALQVRLIDLLEAEGAP